MRYRFLLSGVVSLSVLSGVALAEPLSINPYPEKLPIAPAEAFEVETPQEELAPLPPLELEPFPVESVESSPEQPLSEPISMPQQEAVAVAPAPVEMAPKPVVPPAVPKIVKRKAVLADNVYVPQPGDAYFDPPSADLLAPVMSEDMAAFSEPLSEPIEMDDTALRPEDTYEPEVQIVEVAPITRVNTPQQPVRQVMPTAELQMAKSGGALAPGQSVPLAAETTQADIQVVDQTQAAVQTDSLQVRMSDDFEDLTTPSAMPASQVFDEPLSEPIEMAEVQAFSQDEEGLDVAVLDGQPDEVIEQDVVVIGSAADVSSDEQSMQAEQVAKIESAAAPIETIAWGVNQQNGMDDDFAWHAMPGTDVHSILQVWSDEAGVEMIWDSRTEYSILSKFTARGDYTSAVQGLLDQYSQSDVRPVATLHINEENGQKTLVIRDLDGA